MRDQRVKSFRQPNLKGEIPNVENNLSAKVLRQKAEKLLDGNTSNPLSVWARKLKDPLNISDTETQRLIYELEVHQIEMELQNRDLQHAKEQLEFSVGKYSELYDFSPSGYFTLSPDGDILELNLYGSQLLGRSRNNLVNSRFAFFVAEEARIEFNEFLKTLFSSKSTISLDTTLIREEDKSQVNVNLSGIVANGENKCLIAAIDISERCRAEVEVKIKNEELQRAISEKDKFFSIIAHDLMGPFNGFLGLTDLMVEGASNMSLEEIQRIVLLMKNSAVNLNRLLGNLLEWSRMKRGLISFKAEQIDLRQRITDCLGYLFESARSKNISVYNEIPQNLVAFADRNMFESIIRNLLTNAVKFTPFGGYITISAKLEQNEVIVSVKDSGIGMDDTTVKNLFKLDYDTGRKGTNGELSTGLGLILCKEFMEKNQGRIWVESKEDVGSTFNLTLPFSNLRKYPL